MVGSVASLRIPGYHFQSPGCQSPMSQGCKSQVLGSQVQSRRVQNPRVLSLEFQVLILDYVYSMCREYREETTIINKFYRIIREVHK